MSSAKHKRSTLRFVPLPFTGRAIDAPPVLVASSHTVDYLCANCNTVLMHAEEGQVQGLFIRCTACGSYNSTQV